MEFRVRANLIARKIVMTFLKCVRLHTLYCETHKCDTFHSVGIIYHQLKFLDINFCFLLFWLEWQKCAAVWIQSRFLGFEVDQFVCIEWKGIIGIKEINTTFGNDVAAKVPIPNQIVTHIRLIVRLMLPFGQIIMEILYQMMGQPLWKRGISCLSLKFVDSRSTWEYFTYGHQVLVTKPSSIMLPNYEQSEIKWERKKNAPSKWNDWMIKVIGRQVKNRIYACTDNERKRALNVRFRNQMCVCLCLYVCECVRVMLVKNRSSVTTEINWKLCTGTQVRTQTYDTATIQAYIQLDEVRLKTIHPNYSTTPALYENKITTSITTPI